MARHPIFMGLRDDKKAKDVIFEKAKNIAMVKKAASAKKQGTRSEGQGASKGKKAATKKPAKSSSEKSAESVVKSPARQIDSSKGEEQLIKLNGHELKLTNLSKLYWKKEKFSKGNMVNYYLQMAPYILPYMLDRPQSLNRHPNGIDGPNFFQKDQKGKVPAWMQTHEDFSESTNKTVEYLVCSNEATLIYMANLGCIEMHPRQDQHVRTGD
jgi:bifunctional non-homologous end joining protein LigD